MADFPTNEDGCLPFEIRCDDRDYSGMTIADRTLKNADIEKSFFHGTVLRNSVFLDVKLNNTEFSEATGTSILFTDVDLSGSDFIDCQFDAIRFENCTFAKGEWRDSVFSDCTFANCDFTHTTVALCKFIRCKFDQKTVGRLENRSIYSNIFQQSHFMAALTDSAFCSRNFGVPASDQFGTLMRADAAISIELVCLLNNLGRLRTIDIVSVTESICNTLANGGQRRNSTLKFLCNIVRMLTDERRISATSLMYLERIVMALANTTTEHDVFKAVMDAIVEFRNALVSIATETEDASVQKAAGSVREVHIYFSETFKRSQIELLKDALTETSGASTSSLSTSDVRFGSTIIEFAATGMISTAGLLTALNYVLRQATITVKEIGALRSAVQSLTKPAKAKRAPRSAQKKQSARAPAILSTGAVTETLRPLQAAVQDHGKELAEMDEAAVVTILVE